MEIPLIRVDKKEYLESLLKGQFYMRNSLYYQQLEESDEARGDEFDSAMPTDGIIKPPRIDECGPIRNGRIMQGNTFIKCFYDCEESFRPVNESVYGIVIPERDREELKKFQNDYAIIIVSPNELMARVHNACKKENIYLSTGKVEYLDRKQMETQTRKTIDDFMHGRKTKLPMYFKDIRFASQKEYRFCVVKDWSPITEHISESGIRYCTIDKSIAEDTIILDIGSISDIAFIVKLEDLLNYPIILDSRKQKCYIYAEKGNNENYEGQRD